MPDLSCDLRCKYDADRCTEYFLVGFGTVDPAAAMHRCSSVTQSRSYPFKPRFKIEQNSRYYLTSRTSGPFEPSNSEQGEAKTCMFHNAGETTSVLPRCGVTSSNALIRSKVELNASETLRQYRLLGDM